MFEWLFGKKKKEEVLVIKKIPRNDVRLGRNIRHDARSLNFPFNTAGLEIKNVKHKRYIPIFNQGSLGSCTGNAGVGSIHTFPFPDKKNNIYPGTQDGAIKLYSDATAIDPFFGTFPPTDTGSDGLSIAKALKAAGLIERYEHTFTLQDALKAGTKYSWITGTMWYSDMFNPDSEGRVYPTGNASGGHEYQLSEIDADNGRIWFFNSWGKEWGVKGRFWMTWEDFGTLLSKSGDVTILIPLGDVVALVKRTLQLSKPFMVGEDVRQLQASLKTLRYLSGTVDGIFGKATQNAVITFQKARGLVADGIVGKATTTALESELKKKSEVDKYKLLVDLSFTAREFLYQCKNAGYDLRITSGFRSFAEQQALYDQGRKDKTKPIVTNAKPGQSQHNFGKAFDVCFLGKEPYPNDDKKWKAIADIGKSLGLKPGYYFKKFVDKPHFEI